VLYATDASAEDEDPVLDPDQCAWVAGGLERFLAGHRDHGEEVTFESVGAVMRKALEGTRLAEQQSQAMAARNKMDHNVKGPLDKRLGASGYPATLAVENVSAGYHTLAEAFSGWRDSPPHKANMLKNGVTKLGIAAAYAPNTKYKVFWTLILAST